jgi:hypothetical protein
MPFKIFKYGRNATHNGIPPSAEADGLLPESFMSGFCLAETEGIYEWTSQWSDLLDFTVTPVMDDDEVMHGATDDAAACQTALKGWLSHKAEQHLIPWLKRVSDETGLSYSAVSIRQQQTRWGSCSSRRLISLNARLLFSPPDLVTYVLVHELCPPST